MLLTEKLRAAFLGIVVSLVFAYALERRPWSFRFWSLTVISSMVLGLAGWVASRRWLKSLEAERRQFEEKIESLSYDTARRRALELLTNPAHYQSTARTNDLIERDDLHSSLRDVFDRFDLIVDSTGNRLQIGARTGEFLEVGNLHDGVKLLARQSDGAIFEVWPDQGGPEDLPDYPSLQHWLVVNTES